MIRKHDIINCSILRLYIRVSAPPVLPDNIVGDHVAAQLGKVSFYSLKIYSLSDVNVSLSPSSSNVKPSVVNKLLTYHYTINKTAVKLAMFDEEVDADGLNAIINFTVSSTDGFGEYSLRVSNNEGTTSTSILIVPEGEWLFKF